MSRAFRAHDRAKKKVVKFKVNVKQKMSGGGFRRKKSQGETVKKRKERKLEKRRGRWDEFPRRPIDLPEGWREKILSYDKKGEARKESEGDCL